MYKNPIKVEGCSTHHFGDPFVLRFDGKYYLYPSTKAGDKGVNCYISTDLINYKYYGKVFEDEISECAYAPEVTYYNGKFYLITSPRGNGHYLYESNSPTGPFKRITDNIHNMIDGSFYVDKNNNLYLLRANHFGISMLNLSLTGKTTNRVDLLAPMNGWTEGPGLFYFDDNYYLTYTGNNVCAKGYRISYSTSKYLNHSYIEGQNNPILISTEGKVTRFGHSSNVLGPDLDSRYIVYHELQINAKGEHLPRRFLVDRLDFNGRMMSANSSLIKNNSPKMPKVYGYGISNLVLENGCYFYKNNFNKFTLESVIKNDTKIIFGYKNDNDYYQVSFKDKIRIIYHLNDVDNIIFEENNSFNIDCFNTIRIIYDKSRFELLINDALITRLENLKVSGRLGFILNNLNDISFNGLNNESFNSSQESYPYVVPGILLVKNDHHDIFDEIDGTFAGIIEENDEISYKIKCENGRYFISLMAEIKDNVELLVNDKKVVLKPNDEEFKYSTYNLGFFDLLTNKNIKIEVIKGKIIYKFISVKKVNNYTSIDTLKSRKDKDKFFLNSKDIFVNELQLKFKINSFSLYQKAGLLFEASNFDDEINQARFPIKSFFVGVENGLLVLDYFNYSDKRIYDIPCLFEKENNIKVLLNGSNIKVYLNDDLKIDTTVPYLSGFGRVGFYKNKESKIELLDLTYKEVDDE